LLADRFSLLGAKIRSHEVEVQELLKNREHVFCFTRFYIDDLPRTLALDGVRPEVPDDADGVKVFRQVGWQHLTLQYFCDLVAQVALLPARLLAEKALERETADGGTCPRTIGEDAACLSAIDSERLRHRIWKRRSSHVFRPHEILVFLNERGRGRWRKAPPDRFEADDRSPASRTKRGECRPRRSTVFREAFLSPR